MERPERTDPGHCFALAVPTFGTATAQRRGNSYLRRRWSIGKRLQVLVVHPLGERLLGNYLAGAQHQVLENAPFEIAERQRLSVDGDGVAMRIQRHRTADKHGCRSMNVQ